MPMYDSSFTNLRGGLDFELQRRSLPVSVRLFRNHCCIRVDGQNATIANVVQLKLII